MMFRIKYLSYFYFSLLIHQTIKYDLIHAESLSESDGSGGNNDGDFLIGTGIHDM